MSSGSSSIPVIGFVIGPAADIRDTIASAVQGDWVGSGFSAVGVVPYAGDAVSLPVKVGEFVSRNPGLTVAVAATVAAMAQVPQRIRVEATKELYPKWGDLRDAGVGEKALLRMSGKNVNLNALADALKRPGHVEGPSAPFQRSGYAGETWVEKQLGASLKGTDKQVSISTSGCVKVCNPQLRIIDVYVDGTAHESKVGYTTLTESIRRQIDSDAYLIKTGQVDEAHWHFMASDTNGRLGASPPLLDYLDEVGIRYTIHTPK